MKTKVVYDPTFRFSEIKVIFSSKKDIREYLQRQRIGKLGIAIKYDNGFDYITKENDFSLFFIGRNVRDQAPTLKTLDQIINYIWKKRGKIILL